MINRDFVVASLKILPPYLAGMIRSGDYRGAEATALGIASACAVLAKMQEGTLTDADVAKSGAQLGDLCRALDLLPSS